MSQPTLIKGHQIKYPTQTNMNNFAEATPLMRMLERNLLRYADETLNALFCYVNIPLHYFTLRFELEK